jgi:hypothetical protein
MSLDETEVNKIGEVVAELLQRTRDGVITWVEGRHEQYLFSTNSSSVSIDSVDKDNNVPIEVTILNSDGAVVASHAYGPQIDSQAVSDALDLYRLVHRNLRGVDETLDSLLKELRSIPPF